MVSLPAPAGRSPGLKSLKDFFALPDLEDSPAWEFINGVAYQKPMPGAKHSRLQFRLCQAINQASQTYEALPELRCTFGERSLVPDIVITEKDRIPLDEQGELIETGIEFAPEWVIEILSPHQPNTKVIRNILHILRYGGQLGWLVDPLEKVVLVFRPNQLPDELTEKDRLPVLANIDLELSVDQLFLWLRP